MALTQTAAADPAGMSQGGRLMSVDQARALIESGRVLWLAGDENLLRQLPTGRWIGGSIPYFMAEDGGATRRDRVFVSELPVAVATRIQVKFYSAANVHTVAKDAPDNGFSLLLIPAQSDVHLRYAAHAPEFEDMFLKPIAGWVTGVHLDDLGRVAPTVFNGLTGQSASDRAIVMHVTLKPSKAAHIGIVNTFTQGDGDQIEFPETGFVATTCLVNGVETRLADYLAAQGIDTRLPLVANYSGAMINVSVQRVDPESGRVAFYAPVFKGVKYRFAAPVDDYVSAFRAAIPILNGDTTFCCNCVLNHLYAELEGKRTANMTGPMTFGEIAYQLLNQTMVYVVVEDVA